MFKLAVTPMLLGRFRSAYSQSASGHAAPDPRLARTHIPRERLVEHCRDQTTMDNAIVAAKSPSEVNQRFNVLVRAK